MALAEAKILMEQHFFLGHAHKEPDLCIRHAKKVQRTCQPVDSKSRARMIATCPLGGLQIRFSSICQTSIHLVHEALK